MLCLNEQAACLAGLGKCDGPLFNRCSHRRLVSPPQVNVVRTILVRLHVQDVSQPVLLNVEDIEPVLEVKYVLPPSKEYQDAEAFPLRDLSNPLRLLPRAQVDFVKRHCQLIEPQADMQVRRAADVI